MASHLKQTRVLTLDIAGHFQSVEGKGQHRCLHIHDSPLQADFVPVTYERFILCIEPLEQDSTSGAEGLFQHMLTTTTTPPTRMHAGSDWLVLRLDVPKSEARFFQERL